MLTFQQKNNLTRTEISSSIKKITLFYYGGWEYFSFR